MVNDGHLPTLWIPARATKRNKQHPSLHLTETVCRCYVARLQIWFLENHNQLLIQVSHLFMYALVFLKSL